MKLLASCLVVPRILLPVIEEIVVLIERYDW